MRSQLRTVLWSIGFLLIVPKVAGTSQFPLDVLVLIIYNAFELVSNVI